MDSTYPEIYFCIDQKSFYASVECVERQLDPMTALLVVADAERSKNTICLAVSVGCKKKGIKNRCRLGDIPPNMNVIVAPPRMQLYIDCAAEIHGVFLKYFAPEDIYTYRKIWRNVWDYSRKLQSLFLTLSFSRQNLEEKNTGISRPF